MKYLNLLIRTLIITSVITYAIKFNISCVYYSYSYNINNCYYDAVGGQPQILKYWSEISYMISLVLLALFYKNLYSKLLFTFFSLFLTYIISDALSFRFSLSTLSHLEYLLCSVTWIVYGLLFFMMKIKIRNRENSNNTLDEFLTYNDSTPSN